MVRTCVQTIILRKILGILRSSGCDRKASSLTLFSELCLSDEIPELIRLDLNIKLDMPEVPDTIIDRIPTTFDLDPDIPPMNGKADAKLTVRSLSVLITLWLFRKHPIIHAKLASL